MPTSIRCMSCPGRDFANREEYLEHTKSKWHIFNSDQRLMGRECLCEEEYNAKFGEPPPSVPPQATTAVETEATDNVGTKDDLATVCVMFELPSEKWGKKFEITKGSTIWELKRLMIHVESPEEDLVSFSLKKGMIRAPNFDTIESNETFDFHFCGPEEGQRLYDRDVERIERLAREAKEREEEDARRETERQRQAEERKRKKEEEEQNRKAEEARQEEERNRYEEECRSGQQRWEEEQWMEFQRKKEEEEARAKEIAAEKAQAAVEAKAAIESRFEAKEKVKAEARAAEVSRVKAEEAAAAEEKRVSEMVAKAADEAKSRGANNATSPSFPTNTAADKFTIWEIVGGEDKGGVLIRSGFALSSPKCEERLSYGALVVELEIFDTEVTGKRLHYRKLSGNGPDEGWVSVALNHKMLAQKASSSHPGLPDAMALAYQLLP